MSPSVLYQQVFAWDNLLLAYHKAALGKRRHLSAALFEHQVADRLIDLQEDLANLTYQPGEYVHFMIHDPKQRKISAAPFRDRVVHHALCNVIEPIFKRGFIFDSYANRLGKGTHRAIDRLQAFAKQYRYVLRGDIVQHFPSVDHAILKDILFRRISEIDVRSLIEKIIDSGQGVLKDEYTMVWFKNDDLFAVNRSRGLPIGNLTSQFWSNCYLDPLDHFIKRVLKCRAYLRYVDDFALFSDNKCVLYAWKQQIIKYLAENLRLTLHIAQTQVSQVLKGISWLGFVVYPSYRKVKARNVIKFARRLRLRWREYRMGKITFAEFNASVQGWINHVRYADTWGLRKKVLV
jgi:retron-type reverse transcriptase